MKSRVLIVDDDSAWIEKITGELEAASGEFSVLSAADGKQALEIMGRESVSLVVSDLRMPNMDGFELLNRILEKYPDISVIIVTAYDRPKTRDVVFKSGADDYLTKPFSGEELAGVIAKTLRRKSEGGSLHNVSLETFLQLIEMEQQTCTLRVFNKKTSKTGVLFFRDGDLMSARLGNQLGQEAAYEILSWSGVSVSIENRCPVTEKQLKGELQAILLDAMRTKDESSQDFSPEEEADDSPADEILLDNPVKESTSANSGSDSTSGRQSARQSPAKAAGESSRPAGPDKKARQPAEILSERIKAALGREEEIEDIYEDPAWNYFIDQASKLGGIFGAGALGALYINRGRRGQSVIVPGETACVVVMDPDASRDRIIDAVT